MRTGGRSRRRPTRGRASLARARCRTWRASSASCPSRTRPNLASGRNAQYGFRILVGDPDTLPASAGPPEGLHTLRFTEGRPYDEHEIRRLSPAAKYHRALIGVRGGRGVELEIWGILQSGPRWLQSARGGRAIASPIPGDAVVVRVVGPGRVSVAVGDVTLAELRGGRIEGRPLDLFQAQWLTQRFRPMHLELMAGHEEAMRSEPGSPLDPGVTLKISQQLVKRLIATIRESHHGGTILFLLHARASAMVEQEHTLALKYAFAEGEPRRRYQTLMRGAMRELALASADEPRSERVGWSTYQRSARPSIAVLDEDSSSRSSPAPRGARRRGWGRHCSHRSLRIAGVRRRNHGPRGEHRHRPARARSRGDRASPAVPEIDEAWACAAAQRTTPPRASARRSPSWSRRTAACSSWRRTGARRRTGSTSRRASAD